MKITTISPKTKNFLYNITIPLFYIIALILIGFTLVPMIISPYIDKKNNEYKVSLMQNVILVNKLSLQIYETQQSVAKDQSILLTDLALQHTSAKKLNNTERIKLAFTITEQAKIHNLDPLLIIALIQVESTFDKYALSYVGAKGLMQLLPATAEYINKKTKKLPTNTHNLFDTEINIQLGTAYIEYLLNKTKGNLEQALIAYNMGPGNMLKAKKENRLPKSYSNKVLKEYNKLLKATNVINIAQK